MILLQSLRQQSKQQQRQAAECVHTERSLATTESFCHGKESTQPPDGGTTLDENQPCESFAKRDGHRPEGPTANRNERRFSQNCQCGRVILPVLRVFYSGGRREACERGP